MNEAVALGQTLLKHYRGAFDNAYLRRMRAKRGLSDVRNGGTELVDSLFRVMAADGADFTRTLRAPGHVRPRYYRCPSEDEFADRDAASQWLVGWAQAPRAPTLTTRREPGAWR